MLSARAWLVVVVTLVTRLGAAQAATFTVTRFDDAAGGTCPDPTNCTLRAAIVAANANTTADIINFKLTNGTIPVIELDAPLDAITHQVTIDGTPPIGSGTSASPGVILDGTKAGGAGLQVSGGTNTVIKGLIIESFQVGVAVTKGSDHTTITGCYIGVEKDALVVAGNEIGVLIESSGFNTVGGDPSNNRGFANVISGNKEFGVKLSGVEATGNSVRGNLIGTDVSGSSAVANGDGVGITAKAGSNDIDENVISGNTGAGVRIDGAGTANTVNGNRIGPGAGDAGIVLGNGGDGVAIKDTSFTAVGGDDDFGRGNVINGNGGVGVSVTGGDAVGNAIVYNSIDQNGTGIAGETLGIDLGGDGVTDNDMGDGDTGPNGKQNYPLLPAAGTWTDGDQTFVSGTLNSTANRSFRLQFFASASCSAQGKGQGDLYLGEIDVAASDGGNATFLATVGAAPSGHVITATATDLVTANTSEFSSCATPQTCPAIDLAPDGLANPVEGTAYHATVTASGGAGPYTYTVSDGELPVGILLSSGGALSGSTVDMAEHSVTITASDSHGCPGSRVYVLDPTCVEAAVTPAELPGAAMSMPYQQDLAASGGAAPYSFATLGNTLPAGISLSANGRLAGTPTVAGTYPFSVQVTDAAGCVTTVQRVLVVSGNCAVITVGPPMLPGGAVNADYEAMLTATGGAGPYSFAVAEGTLPPGLTLDTDGRLAGAPTMAGTFTFSVAATDAGGCRGARGYSITVAGTCPTISVGPDGLPHGTVGRSYQTSVFASGGTGPYVYSVTAGQLPQGLNLAPTTGVISGTPSTGGVRQFTVTATDAHGCTGTRGYTFTVDASCPNISISPPSIPTGQVGVAYSASLTASGGTGPYGFAVTSGSLPEGLTLSSTGNLTGMPRASGIFTFIVTATDANGCTGTRSYTFGVCPQITIAPSTLPDATTGAQYQQNLSASGGNGGYSFAVTSGQLPAGLTLGVGGRLSGTPSSPGSSSFTVTATDLVSCRGTRAYAITVQPPTCPAIGLSPQTIPGATVGDHYQQSFSASGGNGPYSYAVASGNLPGGLTLSAAGSLNGTPQAAGSFEFTVRATDSRGCATARAYTLVVDAGCETISLSPTVLNEAHTGEQVAQQLSASGGTGPYRFAVTDGVLPVGVSLGANGALSGAPTAQGSFGFTVTATDQKGCTGVQVYTLRVTTPGCPNIAISPVALPAAVVGTAFEQPLSAAGGVAPYAWTVAGLAPPGVSLSTGGVLSGTPSAAGTYSFAAVAQDSNFCASARQYTLVVACSGSACSGGDAGTGSDGGAGVTHTEDGGCGCQVGGDAPTSAALPLLGFLLLLRRRRRS